MHQLPLNEQIVVIMGAASGIGRETAYHFASRGARLVVADNNAAGLRSLTDDIVQRGGSIAAVVADTAEYAQVATVGDTAVRRFGRIDTWDHVAGVAVYAPFRETTPEEFRRVVDVNLMGQVYGAQVALPHMLQSGGGVLIHVSSVEARRALPLHSSYASSKHGIDGFLEALRVELQHDGLPVTVTQILPSSIDTPFFDHAGTKLGVKPKGVPPLYSPSIVARAIVRAAEHPQRDVVVGGAGKALLFTQRHAPALLDAVLGRVGYILQRTSEPRSADAPNDLFAPTGADNRVEGDSSTPPFRHSLSTWLDQHPGIKAGTLIGAALGTGVMLGQRTPLGARGTGGTAASRAHQSNT